MALEPPPLISREPPRSRRRRRRQQQQSSCCCCLLVAVCAIILLVAWRGALVALVHRNRGHERADPAAGFPVELTVAPGQYFHYSLVPLEAVLRDSRGQPVVLQKPLVVRVRRKDEVVTTVGGTEKLPLRYEAARQRYVGSWPVPWNAPPGEYLAEVEVAIPEAAAWKWETPEQQKARQREERRRQQQRSSRVNGRATCVARARFSVLSRPLATVAPGTCVATWEGDFPSSAVTRPDGTTGDWKALYDWCDYMGADTLWFRGAVTNANRDRLSDQQPFASYNLRAVPALAAEAHHRGLRFGTWAAAYATYPEESNAGKPHYSFARDVSLSTGAVGQLDFISLLDRKRLSDLAWFAGSFQQDPGLDPNVDYVGLDYMRGDNGGYEVTDDFARDMPVKLPTAFRTWPQQRRWAYVARKVEREWQTDPHFYDCWAWWRAHKVAENLRDIIAQAQLKKPLWIFVLSWMHGKQHGQDPVMFSDAGASVLAPMLYQVDSHAQFESMVQAWNEYLSYGQANLMPGDQVDYKWHQKTLQPAAPEELYYRMVKAHQQYLRDGRTVGSFWHDISRAAVRGSRGPYPGTEWALAGGAAFTTVRNTWQVYPMVAALEAPRTVAVGQTFEATVSLTSVVKTEVRRIDLEVVRTPGVRQVGEFKRKLSLGPGDELTVRVPVRIVEPDLARANRFMVCVRVRWPDGDYGRGVRRDLPRMMLVMKYVQAR